MVQIQPLGTNFSQTSSPLPLLVKDLPLSERNFPSLSPFSACHPRKPGFILCGPLPTTAQWAKAQSIYRWVHDIGYDWLQETESVNHRLKTGAVRPEIKGKEIARIHDGRCRVEAAETLRKQTQQGREKEVQNREKDRENHQWEGNRWDVQGEIETNRGRDNSMNHKRWAKKAADFVLFLTILGPHPSLCHQFDWGDWVHWTVLFF